MEELIVEKFIAGLDNHGWRVFTRMQQPRTLLEAYRVAAGVQQSGAYEGGVTYGWFVTYGYSGNLDMMYNNRHDRTYDTAIMVT